MNFFTGRDGLWNSFDTLVVVTSTVEILMASKWLAWGIESSIPGPLQILRTLRVLRIIRLLRAGKVLTPIHSIVHNLQRFLISLAGSADFILSAMLMIFLIVYVFGLTFMGGVRSYLRRLEESATPSEDLIVVSDSMMEHYGTLPITMWTLVAAVTGGVDWTDVAAPIAQISLFYRIMFLIYVLFVSVVLLNILTGIFLNIAMQSSAMQNREIASDTVLSKRDAVAKLLSEEVSVNGSGALGWDEFAELSKDENVKAFLMMLELDMPSVSRIFKLLDVNGDGKLEPYRFVEACMDLRGTAKKVDVTLLQRDNCILMHKMEWLEQAVGMILSIVEGDAEAVEDISSTRRLCFD